MIMIRFHMNSIEESLMSDRKSLHDWLKFQMCTIQLRISLLLPKESFPFRASF